MNQKNIKISNKYHEFKLNDLNNVDKKTNFFYRYQQIKKWKVVSECILQNLLSSDLSFDELIAKNNYKKIKIITSIYFILNDKNEVINVKVLFFSEKYKNTPSANICVNDRLLELELTPNFYKSTTKEINDFIYNYFKIQSTKNISLRIYLETDVNNKTCNFFNKIKNRINAKSKHKENKKTLKKLPDSIGNHYFFFNKIFSKMLQNGLLADKTVNFFKLYYYIPSKNNISFQVCFDLSQNQETIEKWSKTYKLKTDNMEGLINSLCDSAIVDVIFKDYKIDTMDNDDLRRLIQFSNINCY